MLKSAFFFHMGEGRTTPDALQKAAKSTAADVVAHLGQGVPIDVALALAGITPRNRSIVMDDKLRSSPTERDILGVIVDPELSNIPSAACMEANLPKGRKPTPAEIQKAWLTCTSK